MQFAAVLKIKNNGGNVKMHRERNLKDQSVEKCFQVLHDCEKNFKAYAKVSSQLT